MRPTRRQFMNAAGGAMMLGGGMGFLNRLGAVSAAEAEFHPSLVRLGDDIEPTVRLLEDTPRERAGGSRDADSRRVELSPGACRPAAGGRAGRAAAAAGGV